MTYILPDYAMAASLDIDDDALAEISSILEMRHNFSMSIYKDKCMKRRIAIRMRSSRCPDAASYCNLLRQSNQELALLLKTLTIHVSQFFRNPSMFDKLQAEIFPYLFQLATAERLSLRCWSLGCAGGEEAYSLGIILRRFFAKEILQVPAEIHAADIDADTLQVARRAEYAVDRLNELPDSIKVQFFSQTTQRMQLSAEIREMVLFHQRNIMDVATFEPCLLALCRNTLIYFTRPDQEKILSGIAQILLPGGILVLGKAETLVGEARKFFTTVCSSERIYRRL